MGKYWLWTYKHPTKAFILELIVVSIIVVGLAYLIVS